MIKIYFDYFMPFVLFLSVVPLFFKTRIYSDWVYVILFIILLIEMIIKFLLKNYKYTKVEMLFDFISTFSMMSTEKVFVIVRFLRFFKLMRKFKSVNLIFELFKANQKILGTTLFMAFIYMVMTSLILFNVEPETFNNYFDALYWSGIAITTTGYGDIYPVTYIGRFIGIFSGLIGIGIIAIPTGVIASSLLKKLEELKKE